jgi:type VI secretion system secreted protein Hcp
MAIYMNYSVGGSAIQGDVTTQGYTNWIELGSFQWGVGRGVGSAQGAGGNREASTASVSEITVAKTQDQSTGPLLKEAYNGIGSSIVTITFVRTGTPPVAFLSYILTNVMLSGYSASSGGDAPNESLSLNFTKIETDVTATDSSGNALPMYPVTYDLTLQNTV